MYDTIAADGLTDMVGQGWESDDLTWRAADSPNTESQPIVSWEGDMVTIHQERMVVGLPVAFVLEGVPVVAIKRESGSVDFFQIPDEV